MPSTELFRVHGDVADSVQSELETDTLGTVPYYKEVYEDFQRLRREIKRDNKIAKMARALLYYDESASYESRDMPSFDKGLLSMSDAITNGHNVTPQQLSVVSPQIYARFACPVRVLPCWSVLRCLPRGILGVLLDTCLEGRQYSMPGPLWPHGLPVFVSFHFSLVQRFRLDPAAVLRTCPLFLRHFAMAWEARADGHVLPEYCALTLW